MAHSCQFSYDPHSYHIKAAFYKQYAAMFIIPLRIQISHAQWSVIYCHKTESYRNLSHCGHFVTARSTKNTLI